MAYRHYVLKQGPDLAALMAGLEVGMRQVRTRLRLDLGFSASRELADDLTEHIFMEAQDRALVHLVEDHAMPVRYIQIGADSPSTVEAIMECLATAVPVVGLAELQREAGAMMAREATLVVKLALGAGPVSDPVTLELVRRALAAPDPALRLRAVEAVSLLCWAELVAELPAVIDRDPSAEVRELAATAIDVCPGADALAQAEKPVRAEQT